MYRLAIEKKYIQIPLQKFKPTFQNLLKYTETEKSKHWQYIYKLEEFDGMSGFYSIQQISLFSTGKQNFKLKVFLIC